MFGIGGGELIFIIFVALMLFGTDKIPEAARTFAKVISQLKNASNDIKSEIQKSADINGITSSINDIKGNLTNQVESIKSSVLVDNTVSTNPFDKPKEVTTIKEETIISNDDSIIVVEETITVTEKSEETDGPIKRKR